MANSQSSLPEGTDAILTGAMSDEPIRNYGGGESGNAGAAAVLDEKIDDAREQLGDAKAKASDAAGSLRDQAAEKARGYALQGKERAVGALENVTRLVDDAAGSIDEKVGPQYGDYIRKASQGVAGLADTLRDKDVDELLSDARALVRKSPAIAIGAAAAIGFAIARLIKAGAPVETDTTPATPAYPAATPSTATTVAVDPSF